MALLKSWLYTPGWVYTPIWLPYTLPEYAQLHHCKVLLTEVQGTGLSRGARPSFCQESVHLRQFVTPVQMHRFLSIEAWIPWIPEYHRAHMDPPIPAMYLQTIYGRCC